MAEHRKASEAYLAKLRDPRWQKKRLEILSRDNWTCRHCGATDKTLHVHHHLYIRDFEPWDYGNHFLITLCENCHQYETDCRADAEKHVCQTLRVIGLSIGDMTDLGNDLVRLHQDPRLKSLFRTLTTFFMFKEVPEGLELALSEVWARFASGQTKASETEAPADG